mgnify:CR=1 FL=1
MSRTREPHVIPGSVDSHFHALVMKERGLPTTDLLRDAFDDGLSYALDIAVTLDDFEERRQELSELDGVYLSAGLHPSGAGSVTFETAEPELRRLLSQPRVVALGEIGLDRYRDHGTPEEQRELFLAQIELARELGLPVVVHNRDATPDILDVFRAHPPAAESIMHCFSADAEAARAFLDLGFSISYGGNVTYKRSDDIREAARMTPSDRLLVETDAPFLAPQAVRGRPNHPGYVGYTYEFLAELRGEAVEDLAGAARATFERILLA